jgi:hypothetical protein
MDSRLGEMESHMGEKIKGHCGGLEKRIVEGEQHSEECFISLEMFCTEMESERVELEKRFCGLKLEVSRINHFLERESMEHAHAKPGILTINESASARQPSSLTTDSPEGHHVKHNHRDREFGSMHTHTHIPINGTSQSKPQFPSIESSHERPSGRELGMCGDSSRDGQGWLPKLHFPVFLGEDL